MSIIITLILLGIIAFLHELGHFMTAKLFRMPVLEFAIGIGPKLISKKLSNTVYSLRAIPLGGFVSIDGMEIGSEVENGFNSQSPIKRLIVLLAGVTMNFVSAIMAIFILLSFSNMPPKGIDTVQVETVLKEAYASEVLKKGDIITEFNGGKVNNWDEFRQTVSELNESNYKGEEVQMKVLRDNNEIEVKTKLFFNEESQAYILGIQIATPKLSILDRLVYSVTSFFNILKDMLRVLFQLFIGKLGINNLSGPVGLTKVVGQAYSAGGSLVLLSLFVFLSINIGLFNLLPIPALDGGRVIFVLLEFIGIKVNKKFEERFHMLGFALLMGLMVFVVFNDVKNF